MQKRKGRQGNRLFVPPNLTVLKYRDSEDLRGKLINRCLSLFVSELVIPERKGIVDYINIEHDYYEIWGRILKKLGREFVNVLKETSFSQVKNTELKEDLLKMLSVK